MIRTWIEDMSKELIERSRQRHGFADRELIVTTIALLVSLVIAATAVSIGIARADTLTPVADRGAWLAMILVAGLAVAGTGALTAAMKRDRV
jgi:hypothetical protein